MAWASTFTDDLARAVISPAFTVVRLDLKTAGGTTPGGSPVLSSVTLAGYECVLDAREVWLGEERLDIRTWTYSGGEWGFVMRWRTTAQRETLLNAIERGTPLALNMGQASYAAGDYEVVRMGIVHQCTEAAGRASTVKCWDLLTLLRTRIFQSTYPILFGYLNDAAAASTVATTNYVAGDPTLDVADASGFECDAATGIYLLRVTPGSGDPFLLKATGLTANQFTGVTGAQFGTTAANANISQDVESVPLITGNPFEVCRKVLTSTGAGTNGTDDDLPISWGYAIDDDRVNSSDMGAWNTQLQPGSGAHAWTWISATLGSGTWSAPAADESGITTFLGALAQVGIWLCNRQGQITGRGIQDLRGGGSLTETGVTLTDRDLCSFESVTLEWRDPDSGFEWLNVDVATATGSSGPSTPSTNITWPIEKKYTASLQAWIWDNESAQRDAYQDRITPWYIRIPERLRVRIAGLDWMARAVGDLVKINSAMIRGHFTDTATLDGTVPWMIVAIRPGLPEPYVDVELVTLPLDATDERQ